MLTHIVFIGVGYASGAVPWAVLISRYLSNKDVRNIGDGNPGAINAWKTGGPVTGMVSLFIEIAKAFTPVFIGMSYSTQYGEPLSQIELVLLASAPIIGHAWSPFLKFKGGKALAASWGSWIAITGGLALPIGCIFLGTMHLLQKNHAITVTACLLGFLIVFFPMKPEISIVIFWVLNILVVIHKHKTEYSNGIQLRRWIDRFNRVGN